MVKNKSCIFHDGSFENHLGDNYWLLTATALSLQVSFLSLALYFVDTSWFTQNKIRGTISAAVGTQSASVVWEGLKKASQVMQASISHSET